MSEHVHSSQCKQMLGSLSDYIDGDLQAELCAEIEAHMQDCENCRIVVDTLRKTIELYEQAAEPAGLPEGVRERLLVRLAIEDCIRKP
jgi:predicted anti-sigma-YlaC factor YlaD